MEPTHFTIFIAVFSAFLSMGLVRYIVRKEKAEEDSSSD
jgi:hypothetical protein